MFELHAIRDTERRDKVFNDLFDKIREVRDLMSDLENAASANEKGIRRSLLRQ